MTNITDPEVALADLRGFIEDVQAEPPQDFDVLQTMLRREHSVDFALGLLAITRGKISYKTADQTGHVASFFCELPGSNRTRKLTLSTNVQDGFLKGGVDSGIVSIRAKRRRGFLGAGSLPREVLMLPKTTAPCLQDVAIVGDEVFHPANGEIAKKLQTWADEEWRRAKEGEGNARAAINARLESIGPEERAQGAIPRFVDTATRLIVGVTTAIEQVR